MVAGSIPVRRSWTSLRRGPFLLFTLLRKGIFFANDMPPTMGKGAPPTAKNGKFLKIGHQTHQKQQFGDLIISLYVTKRVIKVTKKGDNTHLVT